LAFALNEGMIYLWPEEHRFALKASDGVTNWVTTYERAHLAAMSKKFEH
jgi:hypothetical protein